VIIKFDDSFDLSTLDISNTAADSEVTTYIDDSNLVSVGTGCDTTARKAEATNTAGNDRDYVTVDLATNSIQIFYEDTGSGDSGAIRFKGENSGNGVTSPAIAGNYSVMNQVNFDPIDGQNILYHNVHLIPVGGGNEAEITATVDPTISFSITSTCNLPSMNAATISACALTSVVATNAVTGYTAYIRDGATPTNNGTLVRTGGSGTIPASGGTMYAVDNTTGAGFGVTTTDSGTAIATNATCTNDTTSVVGSPVSITSVTASNQSYATASGVTDGTGDGAVTVCVRAKPSATTPAGSYTTTLTFTAVGNF